MTRKQGSVVAATFALVVTLIGCSSADDAGTTTDAGTGGLVNAAGGVAVATGGTQATQAPAAFPAPAASPQRAVRRQAPAGSCPEAADPPALGARARGRAAFRTLRAAQSPVLAQRWEPAQIPPVVRARPQAATQAPVAQEPEGRPPSTRTRARRSMPAWISSRGAPAT